MRQFSYAGDMGKTKRDKILKRDHYTCQYCGNSGNTIDHIIPVHVQGTSNNESNLVASCRICNTMLGQIAYYTLQEKKDFIKRNIRRVIYARKKKGLDVSQEWNKIKEIFEIKEEDKILWSSR